MQVCRLLLSLLITHMYTDGDTHPHTHTHNLRDVMVKPTKDQANIYEGDKNGMMLGVNNHPILE